MILWKHSFLQIILLNIFLYVFSAQVMAQHNDDGHDHHPEEIHKHSHGAELGMAVGAVPLHDEGIKPAFHVHYLRPFPGTQHIRYGIGGEVVIDEHSHYTASVTVNFLIWRGLQFSVAPGILFAEHEGEREKQFSTHLEVLYEFDVRGMHLGPLLEYAFSPAENHYLVGLHVGFPLN